MDKTDEVYNILRGKESIHVVDSYKNIHKHKYLKTYAIYLKSGQVIRLKAYGYRYHTQGFEAVEGEWGKLTVIPTLAFYVETKNQKGEKGKGRTTNYHHIVFNDVSAVIREDA